MNEIKLTKNSIENAILTDGKLVGGYVDGDGYISAKGNGTIVFGDSSNGGVIDASGIGSFARGFADNNSTISVSGNGAVATGYTIYTSYIKAIGDGAHAEGCAMFGYIDASGWGAHAEGYAKYGHLDASGNGAHAEGITTKALADGAHAEGYKTIALGEHSHAEGKGSTGSLGSVSTASGNNFTLTNISTTIDQQPFTLQVGDIVNCDSSYAKVTTINTSNGSTAITTDKELGVQTGNYINLVKGVSYVANAHSEGYLTAATGNYAHTEGYYSIASGYVAHAEGYLTIASGGFSHAEGYNTTASGGYSHAEGYQTTASVDYSHAEGYNTEASGGYSHSEGGNTKALADAAHAEGNNTKASGWASHAEGHFTNASVYASHAEGYSTIASGTASHAEGFSAKATGNYSHAEGYNTFAMGSCSHTEGKGQEFSLGRVKSYSSDRKRLTLNGTTVSINDSLIYSLQVGDIVRVFSNYAKVASINNNQITIDKSINGVGNEPINLVKGISYNANAHSEGYLTAATGNYSHAKGYLSIASGYASHAEGYLTIASGDYSHAEGYYTKASGTASHAGGCIFGGSIEASGIGSFAHGYSYGANGDVIASKNGSAAFGIGTKAFNEGMMAVGKYNSDTIDPSILFVVGNGQFNTGVSRSNAFWVKDNGTAYSQNGFYDESDIRKKEVLSNISLEKSYELLDKCQEIIYVLKDDPNKKEQVGMIAQEVEEFFPEIVSTDNNGFKSLDYARLSVICLRLIKDIVEQIKEIKNEIKNLKN